MFTQSEIKVVSQTIFGEARGEYLNTRGGLPSLIAVANVIFNRYRKSPKERMDYICKKPYQFSCWNQSDPNYKIINNIKENDDMYSLCELTAKNVLSGKWPDITKGATHYYSAFLLHSPPNWAYGQSPLIEIGNHVFFKVH